MSFHVVIPARFASTRLPGKPLVDINGKPMVRRVADACERSSAQEIIVATDHASIAALFHEGARTSAMMTRAEHASGTDRAAEVAERRGWSDSAIVVNVQGDEPRIPAVVIDQVARLLQSKRDADIATLCTPITSLPEFLDPNVVKVVAADDGMALYFSRAPIPWNRDGGPTLGSQSAYSSAYRHLGIYAYRVAALRRLTRFVPSSLELIEKLEQLRALQNGLRIAIAIACETPGPGIDTESDLAHVRRLFDND